MLPIQVKLTPYNFTAMSNKKNEFIVIHYVGAVSTAKNNVDYYANNKLNASATYFVDQISIWQSVEDKNKAWHCGGGLQGTGGHSFYQICTNSNSIGIEMCVKKTPSGAWYFEEETIKNTIDLVKYLMEKYNIPINKVIRHYDVTGKICPAPYVNNDELWLTFKNRIINNTKHWAEDFLNKLKNHGIIQTPESWTDFESLVTKGLAVALIDKATGGMWSSDDADSNIHWAQPNVISLCGKKVIQDKEQWETHLDENISKSLLLALIDKATGGTLELYVNRTDVDHWGRNNLDSLCDKGIIQTPEAWTDFESLVDKGNIMALICKAFL